MTNGRSLAMLVIAVCGWSGCKPNQDAPVTRATVAAPTEKSEVELSKPKVTFHPPQLVKFEFDYRFTKGAPTKNYMCNLAFPGTENTGKKILEAWELQPEGVIRGGIELQSLEPAVKTFEITLGEADVPQNGYETISNALTGEVVSSPTSHNE